MNMQALLLGLVVMMLGAACSKPASHTDTRDAGSGQGATTETTETTDTTPSTATLTYLNPIKAILDRTCANCHAAPPSGGAPSGFVLNSYEDVNGDKGVASMLARIKARVEDGTMPPNASALSSAERQMILDWIALGAPKDAETVPTPSAKFLSAVSAGEFADASFAIKVFFAGLDDSASWAVYYSTSAGATSGGVEIAASLPSSTMEVTWDTLGLADGAYYLYLVVAGPDLSLTVVAPGSVSIKHNAGAGLTYYGDTKSILDRACANCHLAPPAGGAPTGFVLNSYLDAGSDKGAFSMRDRVHARISDLSMPPDSSAMTSDERLTVEAWIDAGAAEGTPPSTTEPTMTLTAPSLSGEAADQSYPVPASFANIDPSSTWSLHYTTTSGDTTGGSTIFSGLPVSSTQVTWDTSGLVQGTYYLYATLDGSTALAPAIAAGSVAVSHPVGVSFAHPASAGEAANASFVVTAAFTGAASSATWRLYYTTASGAITGGTQIGGDLPVSTVSVSWDTSGLAAGLYYVYAEVFNLGTTTRLASAGGLSVSHPQPGNNSPTVSVTSPNGGVTYIAGNTLAISYSASDPDGDALTYKVEYSADGGATWTQLAAANSGFSYNWAVPAGQAQKTTCRIRVTADDGKGGTASDTSNSNFGIASQAITYTNTVKAILQTYCAGNSCHSSGASQADQFVYSDYTNGSTTGAYDKRDRIWARVSDDSMPKGNPKVSAAEKDKLLLLDLGQRASVRVVAR